MITVRNTSDTRRDVRRATKRYIADPGETVQAWAVDRDVLTFHGFAVVPDDGDDPDGLDDLTFAELRDIATDRDLTGRSTLNRGELIAALRDPEE